MTTEDKRDYLSQFITTMQAHIESVAFIRKHKLWMGFWNYGWVSKILVILAILFGVKFLSIFIDSLKSFDAEGIGSAVVEMSFAAKSMALESYDFLFHGALKYIMLLLLEVIIFHICRRTLEILDGEANDLTFNSFVKAQIRMIKVAIRCYIYEIIFTILIKIFFGIFGFVEFLEPAIIYIVQSYFLGFLVFDNYVEQFNYSIKESMKLGREYIGVIFAGGLVLNILFLIPALGPLIAPLIAAVAVTLVMFRISDLKRVEVNQEMTNPTSEQ